MVLVRVALFAVFSAIVAAIFLMTTVSHRRTRTSRFKTTGARLEPLPLDRSRWSQAPVHVSPLLVCYREPTGELTEEVIHPKTISGRRVSSRGVRPDVVNALCRSQQTMRAFEYGNIVWAADVKSGEFIEDLYHYLGGAQPGGAPAPLYEDTTVAIGAGGWKRHW